jgi:hypothetical protein
MDVVSVRQAIPIPYQSMPEDDPRTASAGAGLHHHPYLPLIHAMAVRAGGAMHIYSSCLPAHAAHAGHVRIAPSLRHIYHDSTPSSFTNRELS